jgi:uncharacterized protein with NRDE domain
MCVVALGLNAHPKYRIVLAANRDEFHARPAAPMARWDGEDSHIIAGRDLQSGGTWLGVSEKGHVAVITNIRSDAPPDPGKASRGDLVADYLRGYGQPALESLEHYNPFSLLTLDANGATLTANRPAPFGEPLEPGIHGLSNGEPHASWPRKDRLMAAFADCLIAQDDLPNTLFALLASESIDDSIFIRDEVYGTRCSTLVLIDHAGNGQIIERRFSPKGFIDGTTLLSFDYKQ